MSNNNTGSAQRYGRAAARGALLVVVLIAGVSGALLDTGLGNVAEFLLGVLIGAVVVGLALALTRLARTLLTAMPVSMLTALVAAFLALWFLDQNSISAIARMALDVDEWAFPFNWPTGLDLLSKFMFALTGALLAGLLMLQRSVGLAALSPPKKSMLLIATAISTVWSLTLIVGLVSDGKDPFETEFSNFASIVETPETLPDPSAPGSYTVDTLSYGAGENLRRVEFGSERALTSRSVDATKLLPEWKGLKQSMRERFWGFGLDAAPLNGLVWAPSGSGSFPLVLIVHGNHGMEDYSDAGYAYLGELLASRGYIVVSVDQNYINGSWSGDFGGKEMAARAWLLLEHLSLWRDWNSTPDHRFAGRVDMSRVALVGHSRGGEAVSIAYAFNELSHFPDDATVAFDYDFDIRSLVAIAQVDQRYQRRVKIADVNFLALQGSYDSDEPAFHGLRQFNRTTFTQSDDYQFKTGIYVHGANHGQFNSTWGREDYGPPDAWLLNTAPIIPGAEQRKVAEVYISAFLHATLGEDSRYRALFVDPRVGAGWLPDRPYVHQFNDSTFTPLATFEEDLDVSSGTAPGTTISAEGFRIWREEELQHRDKRLQGSSAVVLGWSEQDSPQYSVSLSDFDWPDGIDRDDLLTLAISASTESVPDDDTGEDDTSSGDDDSESDGVQVPRFTLVAQLEDGRTVSVDSADHAALAPPLQVRYLKHEPLNDERYNSDWEAILQHVDVPLSLLDGGRGVSAIKALRFRFDQMPSGVVILDDIGFRRSTSATVVAEE